jgi:hypothetical protein
MEATSCATQLAKSISVLDTLIWKAEAERQMFPESGIFNQ